MNIDVRACWSFVRELATDDAYERYLQHHKEQHPDAPPMSRKEFYMHTQQRKWSGVQRCC